MAAYEQLSAFGMSPTEIGKQVGTRRDRVQKSLKVGADATASAALVEHYLTLDQAAFVAEVSDNDTDVARLLDGAKRGSFDHAAQRVRDDRTERDAIAKTVAELIEQGITVIDYAQTYAQGTTVDTLSSLADEEGTVITSEIHAGCPGHVAALRYLSYNETTSVVWACSDWKGNGHRDCHQGGSSQSGAMSEEDKLARREVIANNKAWDSAQTVRRAWLRSFLGRKTAPKDAGQVMASILTSDTHVVAKALGQRNSLATELLGQEASTEYGAPSPLVALVEQAQPARAQVIALGVVLAAVEASLSRHSWRNPSSSDARYLTTLSAWGYELADIEHIITDHQQAKN